MSLFKDAVAGGLANARAAEERRAEIFRILLELKEDVLFQTDNKVLVELDFGGEKTGFLGMPQPPYLVARRANGEGGDARLSTFIINDDGYPVRMDYGHYGTAAHDKIALVDALKDMLSTSYIGEILNRLTKPQGLL